MPTGEREVQFKYRLSWTVYKPDNKKNNFSITAGSQSVVGFWRISFTIVDIDLDAVLQAVCGQVTTVDLIKILQI